MSADKLLFEVTAPHFCAGLIVRNNVVVEAAPILKYMNGWRHDRVVEYCNQKKWQCEMTHKLGVWEDKS